ncbi:MoaD/ThiS family protein [Demequina sp. NBRC 110057]|uniref:MoaD/ThiS family protein n=1 Tax=Demequina sp. NBRC 110057 TaxID=1570346 RepID=UPI0009FBC3DB|nr:MoaD/ThiS family protein [Demequina sp. NBRC 110057]
MATVRLFAAAAEAAGVDEAVVTGAATVGELRTRLTDRFGDDLARVLRQCSIIVDRVRADDHAPVGDGSLVDVLPPFAGG